MLTLLSGFPHDTVAISVTDVLNAEDYESILLPEIEARLQDHACIKLWYEFDSEFKGISVGALWDDVMLGLFHLNDFSRVALVTDGKPALGMVQTLAAMLPCEVNVFNSIHRQEAIAWLTAD